jgi:hypothetical protein
MHPFTEKCAAPACDAEARERDDGRGLPASRSSPALRSVADAAAAISSGEVFCAILQVKKRVGREIILDGVEKMCGVKLLKLGEFGFCLIEDWDIGVGVFPEG